MDNPTLPAERHATASAKFEHRKRVLRHLEKERNMARVTIEDLDVAREWLLVNEGEAGEMQSCRRVAAWIEREIKEREIRSVAREHWITTALARRAVARAKGD